MRPKDTRNWIALPAALLPLSPEDSGFSEARIGAEKATCHNNCGNFIPYCGNKVKSVTGIRAPPEIIKIQ